MLKGEVHERYTDTFLYGLKNGFMEASLKTVRVVPEIRHSAADSTN